MPGQGCVFVLSSPNYSGGCLAAREHSVKMLVGSLHGIAVVEIPSGTSSMHINRDQWKVYR